MRFVTSFSARRLSQDVACVRVRVCRDQLPQRFVVEGGRPTTYCFVFVVKINGGCTIIDCRPAIAVSPTGMDGVRYFLHLAKEVKEVIAVVDPRHSRVVFAGIRNEECVGGGERGTSRVLFRRFAIGPCF